MRNEGLAGVDQPANRENSSLPEFSLAIPLYNEERNAEAVIGQLVRVLDIASVDYELVLVNNGSRDGTGAIIKRLAAANPRLHPVHVPVNQGYGFGILSGLSVCRGNYLGYSWGDNQVHAQDVLAVYRALREADSDMAKATRIVREDGWRRALITHIYNFIFPLFFPVDVKDINGCPKIFTRRAYESLTLVSRDWFLDPEIMIKAHRQNLSVIEVPVTFYEREQGKSNVKWATILEFLKNMARYRLFGRL